MTSPEHTFQEKTEKLSEEIKARYYQHEYTQSLQVRQSQAQLQFKDLELARSRAKFLRENTRINLDTLLLNFDKKITKRGAKVHWAEHAQEAQHIIRDILHQKNNSQVIAARNPVLQEVDFEKAIQNQDIELIYGDINNQISNYIPNNKHISLNWVSTSSLKSIAQAIEKKDGQKIDINAEEIFDYLQKKLLQNIKPKAVGILGADFMISDTGSLSFSDYQGSIQTILAQTSRHIIVVSLSQIIAKLEDLELLSSLKDSYQTGSIHAAQSLLMSAPLPYPDNQAHKALDIIVLDNGRTALYQDQVLNQALECIHCEACATSCPVTAQQPNHPQNPYKGAIGLILGNYTQQDNEQSLLTNSTLCGACVTACPVEIPLNEMIRYLREKKHASQNNLLSKLNLFKSKNPFLKNIKKKYFADKPMPESFYQQWKNK